MALKKGLGKGLSALLNDDDDDVIVDSNDAVNKITEIDINKVVPNKEQPRKVFDEQRLNELAESIKEIGVIQPIVVKKVDDHYVIIAGERRWRACRIAKIQKVPVIVKEFSEIEMLEAALIENIQREDLNPLEEAITYKKFSEEFKLSQEEIAKKVGKNRATVANSIRLLNLDKRVQDLLRQNKLTSGHARTLLGISDNDLQFEIAEKIIEDGLSVREVEELVKQLIAQKSLKQEKNKKESDEKNVVYKGVEESLKNILGTKVNIKNGKNKGKIEIEYYSDEELDRLVCMFNKLM